MSCLLIVRPVAQRQLLEDLVPSFLCYCGGGYLCDLSFFEGGGSRKGRGFAIEVRVLQTREDWSTARGRKAASSAMRERLGVIECCL